MQSILIKELMTLTRPFVGRTDLVQGPGGNTSVKDENGVMIIKASGYRFDEINETQGFSFVKSDAIADYFFNLVVSDKRREEQISTALIQDSILVKEDGEKYPRPSMETGFHAVLNKYVVHTHSVWTNLLNCNQQSIELIEALSKKINIPIAYIPFVTPGLGLSYLVTQEIKHARENNKPVPVIFFLENHGIIAHGDDMETVIAILEVIDNEICELLNIKKQDYPSTGLTEINQSFSPVSPFVFRSAKDKHSKQPNFFNDVLFPDQTVFFNNNISFRADQPNKIQFSEKQVIYNCNKREADSIHETMTAYLFIYDTITGAGYKLRLLQGNEIDYINNMDMEKYRKSLMN